MAVFTESMINERVQAFWAALQRGEFITDAAAAEAGTFRKKGARWMAAAGERMDTTAAVTARRIRPDGWAWWRDMVIRVAHARTEHKT